MSSTFARARLWLVAVVGILAIAAPLALAGQSTTSRTATYHLRLAPHAAKPAKNAPIGQVFGGKTSKGWPVVVELSKDGKKVVNALTGLEFTCTSGMTAVMQDGYGTLPLSAKGAFNSTFGPEQMGTLPTGEAVMAQGAITGARNKAATKMKGTWSMTVTMLNTATGVAADTCTTGNLTWAAKQ
jgi:hypothetical protein